MSPLDRLAMIVLLPERVVFQSLQTTQSTDLIAAEDFRQLFVDRSLLVYMHFFFLG